MVENGKSDITISRLMRLVHWYEVSIADLVQDPNSSPVAIVRADVGASLSSSPTRDPDPDAYPDGQHAMMPVINVYDEGGGMVEPTRHDGEEFVYVIAGASS